MSLPRRLQLFLSAHALAPMSRLHLAGMRLSGWRWFQRMEGMPMLLLTTTGRKSGQARTIPLSYFREGETWVIIASNGGADHAPGWYHNLVANPQATVQIGRRRWAVEAEIADAATKARLWPGVQRLNWIYDAYRARTTRDIPVIMLRPVRKDETAARFVR
jgi:deazaflavin-dependent oxidoreductase (nitroreductase family)